MEQFIRMLHHVGLPTTDIDFVYSDGPVFNELIVKGNSRMCLFTGSQAVAEKLTLDLRGRVKLEDAGLAHATTFALRQGGRNVLLALAAPVAAPRGPERAQSALIDSAVAISARPCPVSASP